MKVLVETPEIAGETVVFRWTQSEPNPFQRTNAFFFRYEGLDLGRFSPFLFYEIFLSLQLKVFAAYSVPVEVVFPEPIPRPSVDYWRAFHDADLVAISPVAEIASYSPWASTPTDDRRRSYAVFFGGGRDSTLATCLLSELYGADQVLLVQYVGPLQPTAELANRLERRQDGLMLRPARERLGVATQTVWTDYQARFWRAGYHARPHLELYTAGALPALLAWGVSLATFCYPWMIYALTRGVDGQVRFRFPRSRPEVLATQTRHYRRALESELTVTNLGLLFTGLMAYRVLLERYPHALEQIVTCPHGGVGERWCYRCRKCSNYALYGLYLGIVDRRFDYDAMFARSGYVTRLMAYAESGVELTTLGNAPWQPFVSGPETYPILCHAVANLSLALVADRVGAEAYGNLITLKALFGNRSFPSVEAIPVKAIDLLGNETARRIGRLATDHLPIVDPIPGPLLLRNREVIYDFGVVMPTRTEEVERIRS